MRVFVVVALLALLVLTACGGGTEIPTAASLPDAGTEESSENVDAGSPDTAQDSPAADAGGGAGDTAAITAAGLPDPASLPVAGFAVTASGVDGGEWTEVISANHSERTTRGGHRALTFRLAQPERESGRVLVTLRLALDLTPGTYEITTDGPVSGEIGVSDIEPDVDFEENVQGTFWLTAPLDEAVTGGFQFEAATADGQTAQAAGSINTLYLAGEGTVTVAGDVSASFDGGVSSAWDADGDFTNLNIGDATGAMGPRLFFMLPYELAPGSYDADSGLESGVNLALPDQEAEFFTLDAGSVTLDEVVAGQGSLYLFGTFDFTLSNNDGQTVTVTGQFSRVRTHLE